MGFLGDLFDDLLELPVKMVDCLLYSGDHSFSDWY